MSWSWSWLKEVLVTLLELILAIAEVVWKWLFTRVIIPSYTLPGSFVSVSSHDRNTALALLGVFVCVLVLTAGPLFDMWRTAYNIRRRGYRPPAAANFSPKSVMQASSSPALSAHFLAKGLRPNHCDRCSPSPRDLEEGRATMMGDRMYHCLTDTGNEIGCIPVLDHFCWWLWVPVSLPTIKPYLIFMVWLPVFHTVSLGILAWPLTISAWQSTGWLYVFIAACFPYMMLLVLAAPIKKQWRRLGCLDSPAREYAQFIRHRPSPAYPMYIKRSDGTYAHMVMKYNPWNKGTILNLRSVLGDRVWTWPLWFMVPRRVLEYGTGEEDLPMSSQFHQDIQGTQEAREFSFPTAGIPLQTLDPVRRRRGFTSED